MTRPSPMTFTHWSGETFRRWFTKCDALDHKGRRRALVRDYCEGYNLGHQEGNTWHMEGWIYICAQCMVEELSERLDTAERERG